MPTINELFPNLGTSLTGIFYVNMTSVDNSIFPEDWKATEILKTLDLLYKNHSGNKEASPLLIDITSTVYFARAVQGIICQTYGRQWVALWNAFKREYNPINNYDMIEQMTNDITSILYGKTDTKSFTNRETEMIHGKTETRSFTDRETDFINGKTETKSFLQRETTRTPAGKTTQKSVSGFNSGSLTVAESTSENYIGSEKISESGMEMLGNSGTDKTLEKGSESLANSGTDKTQEKGTETLGTSGTDMHTRNYTLTRSGNIGVTTSQQMLESEIALRAFTIFRDVVIPNVDELFTLPIY